MVIVWGRDPANLGAPPVLLANYGGGSTSAPTPPTPPAVTARGNIDYDQVQLIVRLGTGNKFAMFTGAATAGHGVIIDASTGSLKDSGSALPDATRSGVQQEAYTYAADSGSANAYAVTLSPAPSIVAGSAVVFKAANSSTTACTLNVNAAGAVAIKKNGTTALGSGDIVSGGIYICVYDGTNYQLLNSSASGGGGSGTVTSVALTVPAEFSVAGSPVTTSGTLAISKANENANLVWAGPTSGAAAAPTFRALVYPGDMPSFDPYPAPFTAPLSANFTSANYQGASANVDKSNRIVITIVPSTGNLQALKFNTALPSTPYTIDACFSMSGDSHNDHFVGGIILRSSGNAYMQAGPNAKVAAAQYSVMSWTSATAFSTFVSTPLSAVNFGLYFVRITDDGTHRTYWLSNNGLDYSQIYQENTNTFLTPVGTGVGFYNGAGNGTGIFTLYNFVVTNSILPQFAT